MNGKEQIIISKTDFLLYRECRKNAWLKIHRPEIYYKSELSDFEKAIIETGNEVEFFARQLFPTGVLIEGRDKISQKKTLELLDSIQDANDSSGVNNKNGVHTKTLFQPVFLKDNFFAAIDILGIDRGNLQKKNDKKGSQTNYCLYEIKATNQIKEKTHLYDLAYQANLLKLVGLNITKICLLHLNPEYVRHGELDITKLFVIDDVTEAVIKLLASVFGEMEQALIYLSKEEEPNGPCECIYKGRSSHCTTFSHSNPQVPEYSVHDIARIGVSKAKLTELIDGNIFNLEDIPESVELSEIQKNQVAAHVSGRVLKHNDKIADELSRLKFPLYFLDYETYPCAIPRFDGFSPYQQIPFQYSLHIVEEPNRDKIANKNPSAIHEPIHREFLHTGSDDPSVPFAESLQKDIGKVGTVVVWNKKFECKINEELAKRVAGRETEKMSSIREFIKDVNSRVYDLMDVFSKQYYVHKDFQGSTSIKYVLPVLAPNLSYKDLEIREGGTASQKWNIMSTGINNDNLKTRLPDAERAEIAHNLLKYCELDTYAMYAIWKHLVEVV